MHPPTLLQLTLFSALCSASVSGAAGPNTFCSKSEETVFGCRYKTKLASVCAAFGGGGQVEYIQYRFGAANPEITIPALNPFDLEMIRGEASSGAHGGSETLVFRNAGHEYRIQTAWAMRSAKYDTAMIQVSMGEKVLSRFECKPIAALGSDASGVRRLITTSRMKPPQ